MLPHPSTFPTASQGIQFCLRPEVVESARVLGQKISDENGVETGVDAFENKLPLKDGKWLCEVCTHLRFETVTPRIETFGLSDVLSLFFLPFKGLKLCRLRSIYNWLRQPSLPKHFGGLFHFVDPFNKDPFKGRLKKMNAIVFNLQMFFFHILYSMSIKILPFLYYVPPSPLLTRFLSSGSNPSGHPTLPYVLEIMPRVPGAI